MTKQNTEMTNRVKEIGLEQLKSVTDLKIFLQTINFIPNPNDQSVQNDSKFYYRLVYETLELFYEKLQYIISDLDDTVTTLFNIDDKQELEAMGVVIDGSNQTE